MSKSPRRLERLRRGRSREPVERLDPHGALRARRDDRPEEKAARAHLKPHYPRAMVSVAESSAPAVLVVIVTRPVPSGGRPGVMGNFAEISPAGIMTLAGIATASGFSVALRETTTSVVAAAVNVIVPMTSTTPPVSGEMKMKL